jgi:hypothetical protein
MTDEVEAWFGRNTSAVAGLFRSESPDPGRS